MLRAFLQHSASLRSAGLDRPITSVKPLTDESATAAARAYSNLPALGTSCALSVPSALSTPYTPLYPGVNHSKTFAHSPSSSSSSTLPLLPSPAHGGESRGRGKRSEAHEGHASHGGNEDDFLRFAFPQRYTTSTVYIPPPPPFMPLCLSLF